MDLKTLQADPEFLLRCAINRDWDTLIEYGTLLGMNVLRMRDTKDLLHIALTLLPFGSL